MSTGQSDVDVKVILAVLGALALCAWCGWASGFHHSSTGALATWSASLAGVAVIDGLWWQGRHHRRPGLRLPPAARDWPPPELGGRGRTLRGVTPWLAIITVVVVWEVLGIDTGPHQPHLTISALAQTYRPMNAALLLVWILVGLGYGAARARAPVGGSPGPARRPIGRPAPAAALATLGHRAAGPALLLPSSRAVGVVFWVGFIVADLCVEAVARTSGGRVATAEQFLRVVSRPVVARVALVAAWAFAGWHLFAH